MNQNVDIRALITQKMMSLSPEQKAQLAQLSPEQRAMLEQRIEEMVALHEGQGQQAPAQQGMDFSKLSGAILGK